MIQEEESAVAVIAACKCCQCKGHLAQPVQLTKCMHILCGTCSDRLVPTSNSVSCPLCKRENPKPIRDAYYETQPSRPLDSLEDVSFQCPICETEDCSHVDAFNVQLESDHLCDVEGHDQMPKLFFCLECWTPVCDRCSNAGWHKTHKTSDLIDLKNHLSETVANQKIKLSMLRHKAVLDVEDEKRVERYLREHKETALNEMSKRRHKVLEKVTDVFDSAVEEVNREGTDISRVYRENLKQTIACQQFLDHLHTTLNNSNVDERLNVRQYINVFDRLNKTEELLGELRVHVMNRSRPPEMRLVLSGLNELNPFGEDWAKISYIGRECKQPPLAFSFSLNGRISLIHSILIIGSNECYMTCKFCETDSLYRDGYDWAIHCKKQEGNEEISVREIRRETDDLKQGRCYFTGFDSGEFVAVVQNKDKSYSLKYCPDHEGLSKRFLTAFTDITNPCKTGLKGLVPRGIAATKDSKILLCMAVEDDDKAKFKTAHPESTEDQRFLMLLSLQGKVLKEVNGGQGNKLSPNCVAVSDDGDVCLCDRNNSAIILLDKNLENEKRLSFQWPTIISKNVVFFMVNDPVNHPPTTDEFAFRPESVCFDRYGRILIADSNNHTVVRLHQTYNDPDRYIMEHLIVASSNSEDFARKFKEPKLLAFGPDGRLWVVCQDYVFVFLYGV